MKVDLEGIRKPDSVAADSSRGTTWRVSTGKAGVIYLFEGPRWDVRRRGPCGRTITRPCGASRWRSAGRRRFLNNVGFRSPSRPTGRRCCYNRKTGWVISPADDLNAQQQPTPAKPLNLWARLQTARSTRVPSGKQMYHETWRIERDFLYDPNTHGLSDSRRSRRAVPAVSRRAWRRGDPVIYLLHRDAGRDHHRAYVHGRPVSAGRTNRRQGCWVPGFQRRS